MGYDGKINNGIELKDAEGNFIQRIIRKRPKILKGKSEVWYSLSYDKEKHRYFDKEFLLKYLNENYLDDKNKEIYENNLDDKNKEIYEKNLINDLITLKTYRDDVDSLVRNQSSLSDYLAMFIAVLGIVYDIIEDSKAMKLFVLVVVLISFVIFILHLCSTSNKSESAKLKFITNAIYTLETIKEDMYRNGNSGTESDEIISSMNDKLDDGNTEDIATEDADETYDGLELTEVKEIRTYTYKATKNKYSPRAIYERKRR